MDLDEAVDELYALTPGEFTARRDALAAQAKRDGDPDLAQQLKAMRRPTAGAHAVNRLARDAADDLAAYLELGARLRNAQAGLRGDQLRALGQERQRAAGELVEAAAGLVEGGLSEAGRAEVEATLRAAVADPAATDAVASGRLTKALAYAGFGEVDLTAATATPLAPRLTVVAPSKPEKSEKPEKPPKPEKRTAPERAAKAAPPRRTRADDVLDERRAKADGALADAREAARQAQQAAERARHAERDALAAQRAAEAEVDDLRDRLAGARVAARRAQQEVVSAQAERATADRAARSAERELDKAQRRRERLADG
ncbi:MAG: hypothetical protein ACTHN8_05425 [Angustibacter sp.]